MGHTSDTETMSERKRRKKLKFLDDAHSEAEIHDLDPLSVPPGKQTFQTKIFIIIAYFFVLTEG